MFTLCNSGAEMEMLGRLASWVEVVFFVVSLSTLSPYSFLHNSSFFIVFSITIILLHTPPQSLHCCLCPWVVSFFFFFVLIPLPLQLPPEPFCGFSNSGVNIHWSWKRGRVSTIPYANSSPSLIIYFLLALSRLFNNLFQKFLFYILVLVRITLCVKLFHLYWNKDIFKNADRLWEKISKI